MMVWHYTTGVAMDTILRDGWLRPSPVPVGIGDRQLSPTQTPHIWDGLKPMLWFSRHPYFEPTARKRLEGKLLTVEQMHRECGLARFGVLAKRLIPWPRLGIDACLPKRYRKELESTGRRINANPRQWIGALEPISVGDVQCIEIMDGELRWMKWVPCYAPSDMSDTG